MRASLLVLALVLSISSCITRRPLGSFAVLPKSPEYLLRSPDSVETPFPEVLQRYNGFEPGRSSVDLRPRMELRVENAYYQEGMPKHGLSGFVGTEIAQYEVRPKSGLRLLSVQPMKNRPKDQLPVQKLIRPSQLHSRYYRFYYEIFFKRKAEAQGSVLLGASSQKELQRLSAGLAANPDSICGNRSPHCTVFPEACSVSLEIEIVVNGVRRTVTWGSLLRSIAAHPQHLTVSRLYKGRWTPVKIDPRDPQVLRLPLLPGDHISWSE